MIKLTRTLQVLTLSLSVSSAFAASVQYLVMHNNTDVQSNAFMNNVPSVYPSKPNSTNKVFWAMVSIACARNNPCPAMIKMATNTPNPIELGMVNLNLTTGEITPKTLTANGYVMTVNGPGEASLDTVK